LTVAIDVGLLDQVKFVADGFPLPSTALAVTLNVVPGVTQEMRTVTVTAGPPMLG
jgi:D-ribose pyranose/furanose isomerase RbsD